MLFDTGLFVEFTQRRIDDRFTFIDPSTGKGDLTSMRTQPITP